MWPYRPQKLTDLLEPEEIRHLLGFGAPARLRSALALVEPAEDGGLRRFDGERGPQAEHRSPFCDYLRHGEIGGVTAFAGADRECSLCEARLAERALAGRETAGPARPEAKLIRSRCHMGLTDFASPVVVRGEVIGAIVAGQCVEEEEQRNRIAKSVGKIGKLTRGEMRSLEETGAPIEAPIRIADERAREALLEEIPKVPRITQAFRIDLSKLTNTIASLAGGRIGAARARWDEAFVASLPRPAELPARDEGSLDWLRSAVFELRQRLRLEYVAVFALYPRQLDEENLGVLPLAAQSGLALEGEEDLSYDPRRPLLELDSRRLDLAGLAGPGPEGRPSERETTGETAERVATAAGGATPSPATAEGTPASRRSLGGVPAPDPDLAERSRRSASSLISALRPHGRSASRWKDVLTKSLVVAPITTLRGLEAVFLFGYPAGETHPESDDLGVLHRSAERLFESYRQLVLELALRKLAGQCDEYRERLKRHAEEEAARRARRKSPLRPQRFDLSKLLEQCLDRHRDIARRRNVTFDVRGMPERLMLQADRNKLEAVLTTVLCHVSRNARSDEEQAGPSVLISLRRERRGGRLNLVFDMLGEFLDPDEQRRLLRSGTPPGTGKDGEDEEPRTAEPTGGHRGGPAPAGESAATGTASSGTAGRGTDSAAPVGEASPNESRPAPEGKEKAPDPQPTASNAAAGERSASDPDSRPASREPTSPGSPPGAPGPGTARSRAPSPISFRECRSYLSWHGGRLGLECVRTARQAESSGRWLGRVIFTVSFRPIEASPEDASGPGPGRSDDRRARADSGSSGRPRRTRSRRGSGGRRGVAGERPVRDEPPREARGERNGPAAVASSREASRGERHEPRPGSGAGRGVEAGAGEDAADAEPDAPRSNDCRKGAG